MPWLKGNITVEIRHILYDIGTSWKRATIVMASEHQFHSNGVSVTNSWVQNINIKIFMATFNLTVPSPYHVVRVLRLR